MIINRFEPCDAACPKCGAKLAYSFALGRHACPVCDTDAENQTFLAKEGADNED